VGEQWIFLNNEFVTKENAKVSVYDHGFLYEMGCLKEFAFIAAMFFV